MESSRLSRTFGCNLDVIKRERYYSVFCSRQWSDQKTEFIIQRWLQRYQYDQEKDETANEQLEETNFPGPSTSTRGKVVSSNQCAEIMVVESPADSRDAKQSLKPIIKTGSSAKAGTASVKFQLPISTVETTTRPAEVIVQYSDRIAKFFNRPICRLITSCLCCVMLPCTLLCASLIYLAKFSINKKTVSR